MAECSKEKKKYGYWQHVFGVAAYFKLVTEPYNSLTFAFDRHYLLFVF